jgi:hypothetical protein
VRRIVTAREQYALRLHWADSAAAATGDDAACDPMTEDCANTGGDTPTTAAPGGGATHTKPSQGSNADGFYDQHAAPAISDGVYRAPSSGGGGSSGGAPSSRGHSMSAPGGGAPSQSLTEALQRAGIDPAMHPLISGFSTAEGNNPSGAPTLGFTDSQAGTTLDDHARALAQQLTDRQSVAGPFPHSGSPADQASWMATVVGQNGVSSDWQGNAQPARSDYVDRIVQNMPVSAPPPAQQPQTPPP